MNDHELLAGFRSGRLDVFPHEDHLRVAYLLVREHGEARGAQEFIRGLRRLAYRFGALPFMLHMTRTKAWIKLIAGEIDDPGQTSAQFLDTHPHLRRKDLLDDYYTRSRLNSLRARITFVEGNRKLLPASATSS